MSASYRPAEKNNFTQLSATEQVARLQPRAEDLKTQLHFDMVRYTLKMNPSCIPTCSAPSGTRASS